MNPTRIEAARRFGGDLCDIEGCTELGTVEHVREHLMRVDAMTLEALKQSADDAARWRGHDLVWRDEGLGRAHGVCSCGLSADVDTTPAPNGIDIGGSAVALNHEGPDR
jgi:hypothetical protein